MRTKRDIIGFFVTRKWPPAVGGMETYSEKLWAELAKLSTLELCALPGGADGMPPALVRLAWFFLQVSAKLTFRRTPLRVVHVGDMALWPILQIARLRSSKTRLVLSAHGTDVAYHRRGGAKGRAYGVYLALGAKVLRSATVIANSAATRHITAASGWRHIDVIPLATDIVGLEQIGAHGGSLLFAGRLVERKGCAWFIRNVLPLLPDEIRLKVAGTKWDADEARALDDPRVDYLGHLAGEGLVGAYCGALAVIVPNIEPKSGEFEGFGLVATEAAAAGGVVLAARTGGLVQAVDDGVTGLLVPPNDADAWAQAITEVAAWDELRRQAFLSRSMRRCRDFYSWRRVAEATVETYGLRDSTL